MHAMFVIRSTSNALGFMDIWLGLHLDSPRRFFYWVPFLKDINFGPRAEMTNHAPRVYRIQDSSKPPHRGSQLL